MEKASVTMISKKPQVVIVGNGFGGVYSAKHLKGLVKQGKIDVSIYGRTNHFLFTPLLHEVATGGLSALSVVEPLDEIFRNTGICFSQSEVKNINLEEKYIEIEEKMCPRGVVGSNVEALVASVESVITKKVKFDFIVVALGATTNFFDLPGVAQYAYTLKNLADAVEIRNHIIDVIERASDLTDEADKEERKKLLSFAVVGGGPTGVELASEISEFARQIVGLYYSNSEKPSFISRDELSVCVINSGPDLIPQFSATLRKKAKKILEKNHVQIYLNTSVMGIDSHGVSTKEGMRIESKTVIWVA